MNFYSYTDNDLLEKPNKYFYTKYHGKEFYQHWLVNRKSWIDTNKGDIDFSVFPKLPITKVFTIPQILLAFETDQGLATPELTYSILENLNDEKNYKTLEAPIRMLLKRFEVNKRIYEQYNAEFKALDKSRFHDMRSYFFVASIFIKSYKYSHNELPFLNGLLKINDTLVSQASKFSDLEKAYLSQVLILEKKLIENLYHQSGIKV